MKQVPAFFYRLFRRPASDQDIIAILQSGDEKQVRKVEILLFERFTYMTGRKPFTEILDDIRDREEAYSDAFFVLVPNIKSGIFRGDSSLKTYFHKIFWHVCMTHARGKATNKNRPNRLGDNPSDELLKSTSIDVQNKLTALMSREPSSLWDLALKQFRHSNYRCYYVLFLHDSAGFSYQEIIEFGIKGEYVLDDDTAFEPYELGGLEEKPLEWGITKERLKNIAYSCRAELRALIERLKK